MFASSVCLAVYYGRFTGSLIVKLLVLVYICVSFDIVVCLETYNQNHLKQYHLKI
jgi:hypothetical protein